MIHIMMLLSCALNVLAAPLQPSRQDPSDNTIDWSTPKPIPREHHINLHSAHESMTDNGAERRLRETASNHFNTTLPRRLNVGDKFNISGKISGDIKIHLLTEDKEVEGGLRLESDFDKKTITLTSHNYVDERGASPKEVWHEDEYGEFEKELRIQVSFTVRDYNLIGIQGWGGTELGAFTIKQHHSKLMYMHILGDITDVVLTYHFQ